MSGIDPGCNPLSVTQTSCVERCFPSFSVTRIVFRGCHTESGEESASFKFGICSVLSERGGIVLHPMPIPEDAPALIAFGAGACCLYSLFSRCAFEGPRPLFANDTGNAVCHSVVVGAVFALADEHQPGASIKCIVCNGIDAVRHLNNREFITI